MRTLITLNAFFSDETVCEAPYHLYQSGFWSSMPVVLYNFLVFIASSDLLLHDFAVALSHFESLLIAFFPLSSNAVCKSNFFFFGLGHLVFEYNWLIFSSSSI